MSSYEQEQLVLKYLCKHQRRGNRNKDTTVKSGLLSHKDQKKKKNCVEFKQIPLFQLNWTCSLSLLNYMEMQIYVNSFSVVLNRTVTHFFIHLRSVMFMKIKENPNADQNIVLVFNLCHEQIQMKLTFFLKLVAIVAYH